MLQLVGYINFRYDVSVICMAFWLCLARVGSDVKQSLQIFYQYETIEFCPYLKGAIFCRQCGFLLLRRWLQFYSYIYTYVYARLIGIASAFISRVFRYWDCLDNWFRRLSTYWYCLDNWCWKLSMNSNCPDHCLRRMSINYNLFEQSISGAVYQLGLSGQ